MQTIRELVTTISRWDGVDAAVVLGRDGLVIDARGADDVDSEQLAAHVPSLLAAAEEFAAAAERGALASAVLEYASGIVLISSLSEDVLLLAMLRPTSNVGELLFALRRDRPLHAALV
jgi:predicted regulator of Ras-like GTPase activity (Roadblock/LC7/MglB family)